jgi:hypothetical protein
VSAGYERGTLIGAKSLAVGIVATAVSIYAAVVLLAFWHPRAGAWLAILAAFAVISFTYGALGLLLGVLVRDDLEGFFVIIMVGLFDTFLQNPVGNPLANKPVLRSFPSFGPMQFAAGGAFNGSPEWPFLALGLAWAGAFAAMGLLIFARRTRVLGRSRPARDTTTAAERRRGEDEP